MKRRTRPGWHVRWVDLAFALALGAQPAHAAVVELADCAAVSASEAAARHRLVADVDCSDAGGAVLVLARGGMLELGDRTLRGVTVRCLGNCRVVGPGTIAAGGVVGAGRVLLRRVAVDGSPGDGVVARNARGTARVTMIDSVVRNSAADGVEFDRRATIVRSQIVGNGQHGIAVSRHDGNDCARGRLAAKASVLADNGRDGDCGEAEVCADVAACTPREAKLAATTCGHSRQLGSGMPGSSCGVCDFD